MTRSLFVANCIYEHLDNMPKPRETCTECSLRRQKCDRKTPCSRCIKRGIPEKCTQKWPGKYDPKVHRIYPRRQTLSTPELPHSPDFNQPVSNQLDSTQPVGPATSPAASPVHDPGSHRSSQYHDTAEVVQEARQLGGRVGHSISTTDEPVEGSSIYGDNTATDLEFLTWGRQRASEYTDHSPYAHRNENDDADSHSPWAVATGFTSTRAASIAFLQLQLPSLEHIWHLVDYHEKCLLWYHGCYHGPTFRRELEDALQEENTLVIENLNLQWVALLFSIMAGSIVCAPSRTLSQWGIWTPEAAKLSKQWYKATITCLNLAEYTLHHQICAVHAIATLTMSAHTLGFSGDLSVLLGAALKIAQSLGLHRLGYNPAIDDINDDSTDNQRRRVLKREIGRRLWSQLCVQDWFSIPFAESHCINPFHFKTTKPSNRDHITMAPLPESFPTYVSYGNYLYDIAKLIAEHLAAMAFSSTPFTKYQQVLDFDARMRTLATRGMPEYFHVTEPIDPTWPVFIPWARRSLTICFAHKIMMIHREFIGQSFINPAFGVTRMTCIAASKTILKEAKQEQDSDGPIIWIDQAFCVAAGITLCLDIFHRAEDEPEFEVHKQLVSEGINMLREFKNSMIAFRGVKLLSSLLAERERMTAPLPSSRKRPHSNIHQTPSAGSTKRQRIDISEIVRSLVINGNTQTPSSEIPRRISVTDPLDRAGTSQEPMNYDSPGFSYDIFEELFPPQAGFSNNFLFEDLFHFNPT